MKSLVYALGGHACLRALVRSGFGEVGRVELRSFPDGETHVRVLDDVAGRPTAIVHSLDRPDESLARLLLLAATLKDLGARDVGLIAPYLSYLRQDARFVPGEGVTARYFARVLSASFDWLLTVEPHLHRIASLDEIFAIPTRVVSAAPPIAEWIRANVDRPLVLGPDRESEPWVRAVADAVGAPYAVATKVRRGDQEVVVSVPDLSPWHGCVPVIVDDILSTGGTQAALVKQLRSSGFPVPVCVAVHAIFATDAGQAIRDAGGDRIVTCDTIEHPTNAIALGERIAAALSG